MPFLPVTTATAGILGLIYIALSARVIMARGQTKTSLGDGSGALIVSGQEHTVPMLVASRSHANFAEYVPLCLILIGLLEAGGTKHWYLLLLAALLIVARVLHPIGMGRRIPNPFRAGGAILTLATVTLCSVTLLVHVLAP